MSIYRLMSLASLAAAGLIVVPPIYIPQFLRPEKKPPELPPPALETTWFNPEHTYFTLVNVALPLVGFCIFLCEWIQRKIIERRIVKLNQYLATSVERLRAWDAQQEQLESSLKMVQNSTSEYNLLLYLVLRQNRFDA